MAAPRPDRQHWLERSALPALRALVCAAGTMLGACTAHLNTHQPDLKPEPAPPPAASSLVVPIEVPIASLQTLIDNSVPRSFGVAPFNFGACNDDPSKGCGPDAPACMWNAGYNVDRTPIQLSGSGQTLNASTSMNYWVRGRTRVPCPGPLLTAGCGDQNDPNDRRHMALGLSASVRLKDDWDTQLTSSPPTVNPTDDCRVGPFGVKNITDKITDAVRNKLAGIGPELDKKLREEGKVKARVERAWAMAWSPVRLSNDVWLVLQPDALEAAQPTTGGGAVRARVGLVARPVVMIGSKPTPVATPLPPRRDPGPANTFAVNLPAEIPYPVIEQQLRKALALDADGVRIPPVGKYFIKPTSASVQGYGTQLVVGLPVTGRVPGNKKLAGTVYLLGTPVYDEATGVLSVPDLDFTVETKSALVKIANFFKHDDWRDQIRGQARLNLKPQIQTARQALLTALNSTQGAVTLQGTIDQFTFKGVWSDPQRNMLRAYALASGTVTAKVAP